MDHQRHDKHENNGLNGRQLLDAYLNGETLNEQQLAELSAWVCASKDNAQLAAELMHLNQSMADLVRGKSVGPLAGVGDEAQWGKVLNELARQESDAQAQVITLDLHKPSHKHAQQTEEDPGTLSAHDLASVGGYLLGKAALSKPALYAYAAAVAILALVLINPWAGSDDAPNNTPTAQQDPQQQPKPVATLTATHNAAWSGAASAAPAPGSPLYPNQRLTLTQGFAQITTAKGAKAIIHAPATFELINNNALRLHTGKLVGICETKSSKRFLVRTPHMNVTDLGTRFGVAVDQNTRTFVIEGQVQVAAAQALAGAEPVRLKAGRGALAHADAKAVMLTDKPLDRFVTSWQALANPPKLTGDIRYEPSAPADLQNGAYENQRARLIYERSAVVLDKPLAVTFADPGRYDDFAGDRLSLPAAARVDSYLVHYDPPGQVFEATQARSVTMSIRFNTPILGVIATGRGIVNTHGRLGCGSLITTVADLADKKQINQIGLDHSNLSPTLIDRATISEDRRTLTLQLYAMESIDQVRVLVQSEGQDQ